MTRATAHRVVDLDATALDALVALAAAATPHPWTRGQFADELARPQSRVSGLLFDVGGAEPALVAYVAWWQVLDEVEILDVATDPRWRRQGLARAILQDVLARAAAQGATRAFLEVRASNLPAQALYRALGFVESGRRRGYYSAEGEDALLLSCVLEPG